MKNQDCQGDPQQIETRADPPVPDEHASECLAT
jgi:hypothetical protein